MTSKVTTAKLSDFHEQRVNMNRHTPRGMSLLETAMREDGYIAPMTVAADGEVIDGSARHEMAVEVFSPEAEALVVEHDGTKPIVMKLTNVPNAQDERALRISARANRIGQLNLDVDYALVQQLRLDVPAIAPLWTDEDMTEVVLPVVPAFTPVGIDEQGRLDEKKKVTCPECGHVFSPTD